MKSNNEKNIRRYSAVLVAGDGEGIWNVGYSPVCVCGESICLSDYCLCKNIYQVPYSDCARSRCSNGRCFWDCYFSLIPGALKQVLALHPASPLSSQVTR
jgi:hypothetical protein